MYRIILPCPAGLETKSFQRIGDRVGRHSGFDSEIKKDPGEAMVDL